MSIASAKACIDRILTDEDFAKAIISLKSAADRMAYAKSAGYDFTREDFATASGALSVEEMETVVGGVLPKCHPTTHPVHPLFPIR